MTNFPKIEGFEIIKKLGEGGSGQVFLATQKSLNRKVAIKILTQLNQNLNERFEREAKILAKLSHMNIISCYDAGVHDNQMYIIMEYVEHGTLKEWVAQNGPLDSSLSIQIILILCRALSHALQNGVVHRDVKAENILLLHSETEGLSPSFPYIIKLADLGLGCHHHNSEENLNLTMPGTIWGTPTVMAPEQFFGNDQIDEKIDIYGLGCLLYFMLTAEDAFCKSKSRKSLLSQKIEDGILEKKLKDRLNVDTKIGKLITHMTKPQPAERISSYSDLSQQLSTIDTGTSNGRQKYILIAASLALCITLAVTLPIIMKTFNSDSNSPTADQALLGNLEAIEKAESQEKVTETTKKTEPPIIDKEVSPVTPEETVKKADTKKAIEIKEELETTEKLADKETLETAEKLADKEESSKEQGEPASENKSETKSVKTDSKEELKDIVVATTKKITETIDKPPVVTEEPKLTEVTKKIIEEKKKFKLLQTPLSLIDSTYTKRLNHWQTNDKFWLVDDEGDGILGRGKDEINIKRKLDFNFGKMQMKVRPTDSLFFGFYLKDSNDEKLAKIALNNLGEFFLVVIKCSDKINSVQIKKSSEVEISLVWIPDNEIELTVNDKVITLEHEPSKAEFLSLFTKKGSTIFDKINFYPATPE